MKTEKYCITQSVYLGGVMRPCTIVINIFLPTLYFKMLSFTRVFRTTHVQYVFLIITLITMLR